MKIITFLLAGSALLLSGCAGVKSSFDCDATTSDTCMTMTKANQLARDKAAKQAGKQAAGGLPSLVNLPAQSTTPPLPVRPVTGASAAASPSGLSPAVAPLPVRWTVVPPPGAQCNRFTSCDARNARPFCHAADRAILPERTV